MSSDGAIHTDSDDAVDLAGHIAAGSGPAAELLAALPIGVVVQAPDGSILASNDAASAILRLSREQLEGRTSMDPSWRAVHPDGTPFPGEDHPAMRTLRSGRVERSTMGVHTPEGEVAWIDVIGRPVHGRRGDLIAAATTFVDVTAERAARHRQDELLERYRTLAREGSDVVAMLDRDGTVREVSGAAEDLLGRSADGLVGEPLAGLFPDPTGFEGLLARVADRPRANGRVTLEVTPADGLRGPRWFEVRLRNHLEEPAVAHLVATLVDVHDRVVAEDELREVNQRLAARLAELDRAHRQDQALDDATELLARGRGGDEVAALLWDGLDRIFPDADLGLRLVDAEVEALTAFRTRGADLAPGRLGDCWAARTRRVHVNEAGGLRCRHELPDGCSACIPFVVDGRIVAAATVGAGPYTCEELARVAETVASRMSKAIPPAAVSQRSTPADDVAPATS
ncbi:MAG: PAS domain-containing protein [Microthrixaceae bacterium]